MQDKIVFGFVISVCILDKNILILVEYHYFPCLKETLPATSLFNIIIF